LLHIGLPSGTSVDYVIDGQNRRVGKKLNGALSQGWLYQDQLRAVAQLDGNDNVVLRFFYGSKPNVPDYVMTFNTAGTALGTYRVVSDHLGSPRLVVDSVTGNVVETISFDEFGNETDTLAAILPPGYVRIPFGFAGGFYDTDTGLVRFGARDYDASVGRWITKDRSRFRGGINLYGYCNANPVNCVDRTGRNPPAAVAIGTVLVSGGEAIGVGVVGAAALAAIPWAIAINQGIHLYDELFPPTVFGSDMVSSICDFASSEKQQIRRWANALGIPEREVGNAIERIKHAAGLRPNQNVDIDPDTGDVSHQGETIGNVGDEVGDSGGER